MKRAAPSPGTARLSQGPGFCQVPRAPRTETYWTTTVVPTFTRS
jgi:hypothetical protein